MLSFNVTWSALIQNKQNEKQLDYRFHYGANNKYGAPVKSENSREEARQILTDGRVNRRRPCLLEGEFNNCAE